MRENILIAVSHELRTPLTAILGYAEILARGQGLTQRQLAGDLLHRAGLWQPEGWPGLEVGWAVAPAGRTETSCGASAACWTGWWAAWAS